MPQQTEVARRVRLSKVDESLEGEKIRVVGRVLSYDAQDGVVLLIDESHGLLVDISLALDERAGLWATEKLSKVMLIGRIERVIGDIPKSMVPGRGSGLQMREKLVLRAFLATKVDDLDLKVWNATVEEEEKTKEEL
ncbi:hypothetical protein BJ165DRAFT_1401695 [Panaeolus papilionaceus]|nr:hypothetical protein BJ165DRAFT_1401695 [Panaeolus papilionaceus]